VVVIGRVVICEELDVALVEVVDGIVIVVELVG
jgi:hypothetical protein